MVSAYRDGGCGVSLPGRRALSHHEARGSSELCARIGLLQLSSFLQYDTASRDIGVNTRLRWSKPKLRYAVLKWQGAYIQALRALGQ